MPDSTIKYFTINPKPARKCDRCHVIIGPDAPLKVGILIKDGPCQGFFHSVQCWETANTEMENANQID